MQDRILAIEDLLHPFLGRYLGSPAWLKASAGRAYSKLPARVRLGGAYDAFRRMSLLDGLFRMDIARGLYPAKQWRLDFHLDAKF